MLWPFLTNLSVISAQLFISGHAVKIHFCMCFCLRTSSISGSGAADIIMPYLYLHQSFFSRNMEI